MSINAKMTAIADAIRAVTGGTAPLSLDAMAAAIPAVRAAGEAAATAACAGKHFVGVVHGGGTKSLSVQMPFDPDALTVMAADMRTVGGQVVFFNFLPRSVSHYIGLYCYTGAGSTSISSFGSLTRAKLDQAVYADGVFTLSLADSVAAAFDADTDYIVLASKTETRTNKEILTDFVAGLADTGGSVTVSQAAVNAAVTDAEWATLIATKPNRTFVLK